MNVQEIVNNRYGKGIAQCSNEEIYYALLEMTKSMAKEKESNEGKRKLYYISAEFLPPSESFRLKNTALPTVSLMVPSAVSSTATA